MLFFYLFFLLVCDEHDKARANCQNGGRCILAHPYRCDCPAGWTGNRCQHTRLNEYAHYLAYMITETLQISYLIKHKETQQVNKIGTRQ